MLFLLFLTMVSCAICFYRSTRNFFALISKMEGERAKDFDVYYLPIFVIFDALCISTIYESFSQIDSREVCNEFVLIGEASILGGCFLQLAINWSEVVGKIFGHFLTSYISIVYGPEETD